VPCSGHAAALRGGCTENPSFELNNALLSQALVYLLKALGDADGGLEIRIRETLAHLHKRGARTSRTFPDWLLIRRMASRQLTITANNLVHRWQICNHPRRR
jgi:replication-associated recombination protein RarA